MARTLGGVAPTPRDQSGLLPTTEVTTGMSKKMKWVIGGSIGAVLLITGIILIVKFRK